MLISAACGSTQNDNTQNKQFISPKGLILCWRFMSLQVERQKQTIEDGDIRRGYVPFCYASNSLVANSWHSPFSFYCNFNAAMNSNPLCLTTTFHSVLLAFVCLSVCISYTRGELSLSTHFFVSRLVSQRPPGLLYIARGAAGIIFVRLGSVVHLPNDLGKEFIYHSFALGRGLHERTAPLLSQSLTFTGRHLPLTFQVHLVAHQDHGNLLVPEDKHRSKQEVRPISQSAGINKELYSKKRQISIKFSKGT